MVTDTAAAERMVDRLLAVTWDDERITASQASRSSGRRKE